MKHISTIAITSLFLLFLFLPLSVSLVTPQKQISQSEKRKLAALPEFSWQIEKLSAYPLKFEKYFNDHFGLREQLVGLYNLLYVKILNNSPSPLVVMGKGDWIFYAGEGTLEDYLGLTQPSSNQLERWYHVLKDRQEWLADLGIQYLLVIPPNKMMVYPEKLPWRIQKMAGPTALELFADYLKNKEKPLSSFVDLRTVLAKEKEKEDVYFHTDTHWNNRGAYLGYRAILDKIRDKYPDTYILSEAELRDERVTHTGDLSLVLKLGDYLQEKNVVKYRLKNRCTGKKYTPVKGMVHPDPSLAGKTRYLPVENGCPERQMTVLMVHDSFGLFLRDYFSQSFKRVVFSHYIDLKDLKDFIREEKPDVVIDERVARNLRSALEYDQEIENYIINKHYGSFHNFIWVMDVNSWKNLHWEGNNLELRTRIDGINLLATGNDPFFECNLDIPAGKRSLFLKMQIYSPVAIDMELFYKTDKAQPYDSSRKVSARLKEGENLIYLRLPTDRLQGLRVDPGNSKGEYILHSLSIGRLMH